MTKVGFKMHNSSVWRSLCISVESSIEDAIRILNDVGLKIVLVVDHNQKLVGTITDGDIRRGLLRGLQLSSPTADIINKNPISVLPNLSRDQITKTMLQHNIMQIPIVDKDDILIGLHLIDDNFLHQEVRNKFVIMAGGKGTRLLPRTEGIPKPMLKISDKPILEHIILRARGEGFRNFVIAVHHLSNVIEEYFENGNALGVKIEYIREKTPLGTAGGLRFLDTTPGEPFIVTNGDVITDVRYRDILEFHTYNEAFATMAVQIHEWKNPFGVVQVDGSDIINYEEKPITRSIINAGVYVLNPLSLTLIEKENPTNMSSLFEMMILGRHKLMAYPIHEKWTDIGRHEDLERAILDFKRMEGNQ